MPSATTQIYSFPAQLGRRGSTMVAVIALHVLLAVGLILGTVLKAPPKAPAWVPPIEMQPIKPIESTPVVRNPSPSDWTVDLPTPTAPDIPLLDLKSDQPYVPPQPAIGRGTDEPTPPAQVSFVRVLRGDRPFYPAAMRRAGQEGSVDVRVRVGATGRAEEVGVAHSSGFPAFDRAAVDAVKRWIFAPAQTATGPITAWVTLKVTFRLTD